MRVGGARHEGEPTPSRSKSRLEVIKFVSKADFRFGSGPVMRPLPQAGRFVDSPEPDGGDKFALDTQHSYRTSGR